MQNFYQVTPVLTADSMTADRRHMCTGLEAAAKSDGIFYSSIPQITSLLRALPKLLVFFFLTETNITIWKPSRRRLHVYAQSNRSSTGKPPAAEGHHAILTIHSLEGYEPLAHKASSALLQEQRFLHWAPFLSVPDLQRIFPVCLAKFLQFEVPSEK